MNRAKPRPKQSYEGLALAAPVSFGYAKQSPHDAAWFIGGALREMLAATGIAKQDIDGFSVSSFSLGADSPIALTQHFQLSPRWIEGIPLGGASGIVALRRAARAVQAGDADIVACIGGDTANSFADTAAAFSNFSMDAAFPYGAAGPNMPFSLITQQYMDRHGAQREDFGRIAIAQRYNANHFPPALLGHKTLTMAQYLDARPIAGPLHLFDCVLPCAGAEAFLMLTEERARYLKLPYCRLLAADELHNAHQGDALPLRGGWTEYIDELYETAGIGPGDIDLLQTYDDYPVISMLQMEDLGFCNKGEAAALIRSTDLTFDASGPEAKKLPHNTSGGQLSVGQAGAAGGFLGLVESIRQLTLAASGRQVAKAHHAMVSGFGMINYDRGLCSAAAILAKRVS